MFPNHSFSWRLNTLSLAETHTEADKLFYHGVAAIIGQDDDVDGRGVIGHTDAAILWFVLSEIKQFVEETNIQLSEKLTNIHSKKKQLYTEHSCHYVL